MFFSFGNKKALEKKKQTIKEILELDTFKESEFADDTKSAIEKLRKEIDDCVEVIANSPIKDSNEILIGEIKGKVKRLSIEINSSQLEYDRLYKDIELAVEKGVEYIDGTNFYPPEFVFNLNKLKGMLLEIEEIKKTNPLASSKEFEDFKKQVEDEIEEFKKMHEKTVALMKLVENKKKENKAEPQEIIDIKEKLFRLLQFGKTKEAEEELKKFEIEAAKM